MITHYRFQISWELIGLQATRGHEMFALIECIRLSKYTHATARNPDNFAPPCQLRKLSQCVGKCIHTHSPGLSGWNSI